MFNDSSPPDSARFTNTLLKVAAPKLPASKGVGGRPDVIVAPKFDQVAPKRRKCVVGWCFFVRIPVLFACSVSALLSLVRHAHDECRLETMSPASLVKLSAAIDAAILNNKNLKNLEVGKQRTAPKIKVLEVIDFCTGLPQTWSATGPNRNIGALHAFLAKRAAERGHRIRNISLLNLNWGSGYTQHMES